MEGFFAGLLLTTLPKNLINEISGEKTLSWFYISIWGNRKEGKTTFLARFSHNLSRQHANNFTVLWWKNTKNFCDAVHKDGPLLSGILAKYKEYFSQKKRFVLIVDDIVKFGETELYLKQDPNFSLQIEDEKRQSVFAILQKFKNAGINIVFSAPCKIDRITEGLVGENDMGKSYELCLDSADAKNIYSKLIENQVIDERVIVEIKNIGKKYKNKSNYSPPSRQERQGGFGE